MNTVQIPDDMAKVTQEEFFKALYADSRDIMPSLRESPFYTVWEIVGNRRVWGWSSPGWKNPGSAKVYALRYAIEE